MNFTYDSIKEEVRERRSNFREYYLNFFDVFEELYNPELIKHVYIKNIFNDEKTETIFFFEDKIVIVSKQDVHFLIEEHRGKVINKVLYVSKQAHRETKLELTFENDKKIIFDNYKDSNDNWGEDYGFDIKELYKSL